MKKILFILPNLEAGGAERVLLNYIRLLIGHDFDISLIIINDFGELQDYIPKNINLINLNINRTRNAFFKLIRNINRIKPDYILTSSNRTNLLLLMTKYFFVGKPKVIIREPNTPSAQFGENYLNSTYFKLMKFFYPKANLIIAQTEAMKTELVNTFQLSKQKISVIHNPIDTKYIDEKKDKHFDKFDKSKINIVASGRLHRQKGFDFLIKSFDEVIKQNTDFRLFIIGKENVKDNCTKELKELTKRLHLENYINFCGFQTNPYPFYQHADLLVLSSRWEGLPNVVLESQYLGTPVVATKCVTILSELIENDQNGRLCDFGDIKTMTEAILNFQTYKQLSGQTCDTNHIPSLFN